MENRWSDEVARGLDPLQLLVYRSNLLGADPTVVNRGGGNTSIKRQITDFRGLPVDVLTVKATGYDLRTIGPAGFCDVRIADVLPLRNRDAMSDEEMVAYLARCLTDPTAPRPSIETLLHAFLPFTHVDHTHADAACALATAEHGEAIVRELFGEEAVWIPYVRPGFAMSKMVADAVERAPLAKWVILQKHGLLTWANDGAECYARDVEFLTRAGEFVRSREASREWVMLSGSSSSPAERRQTFRGIAPSLRGLLGAERRVVLHLDDADDVLEFVNTPDLLDVAARGLACPDHVLTTGVKPLALAVSPVEEPQEFLVYLDLALADYEQSYRAYFAAHSDGEQPMAEPRPRVLLVPGLGMVTAGRDKAGAMATADTYRRAIAIMRGATAIDRFTTLTPKETFHIEYWPLELYKLTLAPPEKEVARRVALVTGGAGALGRSIAERLAREGAQVVIADIDRDGAQALANIIGKVYGTANVLAVHCDVTREGSVQAAFDTAIDRFGGIDIVVSNAGYASSYALEDLTLEEWRRTFDVLVDGYFLVSREAVRVMKEQRKPNGQTLGGSIIFVASKAGLAPARNAAAYASAKAAELHLARCIAEEAGPFGIRVNSLAPDAIIEGSGLWAGQWGQARAESHGVPMERLSEFYRQRNLMKVSVTADDVAEAALFFASERSAKTTGAILTIDGGLAGGYVR